MTKAFAVTDNRFIFEQFSAVFAENNIHIDFYCSPKSNTTFAHEIQVGIIKPIALATECAQLLESGYQFGFSCHSKQIFPPLLVNSVPCINIHPGYNPYNRGWFPQVFSILNKKPAGITIHMMDEQIDHGPIIAQEQVAIESHDTSLTAYNKIIAAEIALFRSVLPNIINGSCAKIPMKADGNYNSIKDYKALLEIDMNKTVTMREAIDYLRAMTHPPYKNAYFIDEKGRKIMVAIDIEPARED